MPDAIAITVTPRPMHPIISGVLLLLVIGAAALVIDALANAAVDKFRSAGVPLP